jgi:hypothetical protein
LRGHLVWTCFFICMCWDPVNQHVFLLLIWRWSGPNSKGQSSYCRVWSDHTATWLNPRIEIISYDPYFVHEILTMLVECCLQPLWGKLHFYRAVLTIIWPSHCRGNGLMQAHYDLKSRVPECFFGGWFQPLKRWLPCVCTWHICNV